MEVHEEDDKRLGEPLCARCFDYSGVVLWNAHAPELWRRTVIYTRRMLARFAMMSASAFDRQVRLSYARVIEYQRRGVVHVHAVFRLDAATARVEMPSSIIDASQLALAIRIAAPRVFVASTEGACVQWGEQLDARIIQNGGVEGLQAEAVANYVAKYATKSVAAVPALDYKFRSDIDIARRNMPEHLRSLAATAWKLGDDPELSELNLQVWAHDLGFRGHWLTKSRNYSTTFKALKEERQRWQEERIPSQEESIEARISHWKFVGRGWKSIGDAYLAEHARRDRDSARQLSRESTSVSDVEQ